MLAAVRELALAILAAGGSAPGFFFSTRGARRARRAGAPNQIGASLDSARRSSTSPQRLKPARHPSSA